MNFLENDLEDIIYNTSQVKLQERGLDVINEGSKLYRQLNIGNYGRADLVEFTRSFIKPENSRGWHELIINVYELKKEKIGMGSFLQALNYIKGIDMYLKYRNKYNQVEFIITLIGREIENGAFIYLPDYISNLNGSSFIHLYTYDYEFDGIKFTEHDDYSLTNPGF
jgi:hypothetical protein